MQLVTKQMVSLARQGIITKIPAVQGDTGRAIDFTITDMTLPVGTTARFFARKPSGKEIYNDASITGNTVHVNLTSQCLAELGTVEAQVQLVSGGDIISTYVFEIIVAESVASETAIESTNEYGVLDELIKKAYNDSEQTKKDAAKTAADRAAVEQINTAFPGVADTAKKEITALGTAQKSSMQAISDNITVNYGAFREELTELESVAPYTQNIGLVEEATGSIVELTDAAEYPMQVSTIGKSEQVSTTGAQIFDASKIPTQTSAGVILTNNGDGSFTVSGTGSITANFAFTYQYTHEETVKLLTPGKYRMIQLSVRPYCIFKVFGSGTKKESTSISSDIIDITQEDLEKEDTKLIIGFYAAAGTAIVSGTFKPMVWMKSTVPTNADWEPYTGGKPSPSPEYQQEIKSVGDSGTLPLVVGGRNIFNPDATDINQIRCKVTELNGIITIQATGSDCYAGEVVSAGGLYYKSCGKLIKVYPGIYNYSISDINIERNYITFYDKDKISLGYIIGVRSQSGTFTVPDGAEYLTIRYGSNTVPAGVSVSFKFSIARGKEIQPWELYKAITHNLAIPPHRGIRVESGGNYTDASGQQWIVDKTVVKDGQYGVMRYLDAGIVDGSVGTITSNQAWINICFSTSVFAGKNIKIISGYNTKANMACESFEVTTPGICSGVAGQQGVGLGFGSMLFFGVPSTLGINKNDNDAFKAYIATHPVKLIYEMETPVFEPYPAETQRIMRKLFAIKDYTSITTYDPLNPDLQIRYNKDISIALDEFKSYLGYTDNDIIGLQVDYQNKTFQRLGAAEKLKPGADFDKYRMYGGRKRCTVADNGTINHYYGDAGYKEDGTDGQVMVYQPRFYYRVVPLKTEPQEGGIGYHLRKANYYVSDTPRPGFKLHPAFFDENGNEVDHIFYSAYEGSLYDVSASKHLLADEQVADFAADKLCSIAGAKPASGKTQNLTRPNVEQLAKNRGAGWHGDIIKAESANQLLMIIELGTMNTQDAVGQGAVAITDTPNTDNHAIATGGTSGLGNKTGQASGTNGQVSISYRGFENPWGNIWKFVYGVTIHGNGSQGGGIPYICKDYNYAESKNSDNYDSAGFMVSNVNGYVSAMGYSESYDWLFIPSEAVGNSSLPVGDFLYATPDLNGYHIALLGGVWYSGGGAGGFDWYLTYGVGYRSRHVGGRLVYVPQREVSA